ncbi:uncharacterized protein ChrSV_p0011 (plasmid) [Chromobacterium vaccinii]|nr:uncharacterized protein ChrSW_p0011 [Chromobacterium vaccinii]QND87429.1 uncharacterized protein ChrSV_p0011 [Chromobacterium vaccinii]
MKKRAHCLFFDADRAALPRVLRRLRRKPQAAEKLTTSERAAVRLLLRNGLAREYFPGCYEQA